MQSLFVSTIMMREEIAMEPMRYAYDLQRIFIKNSIIFEFINSLDFRSYTESWQQINLIESHIDLHWDDMLTWDTREDDLSSHFTFPIVTCDFLIDEGVNIIWMLRFHKLWH